MGWSRSSTSSEAVQLQGSSSVQVACVTDPSPLCSSEFCLVTHSRGHLRESGLQLQLALSSLCGFYTPPLHTSFPSLPIWLLSLSPHPALYAAPPGWNSFSLHFLLTNVWRCGCSARHPAQVSLVPCLPVSALHWPCQFAREETIISLSCPT